ncbi:PP2C family serine/threonine-protein phosphatase [Herbiconiux sp. P17]|uniref:PP2C family protein-serine/threonine phosphatase n=2 Tax=Herbiconiux wuyangfengii TaxID=3342794 RepID=UPI0035B9592A
MTTHPDSIPSADLVTSVGAATHTGLRRASNEDSYLADTPVFLVADGMGGHEAGEVASSLAVGAFAQLARQAHGAPLTTGDLRGAFEVASRAIAELGHSGLRSAGTTVSGVAIAESDGVAYWLVFNLGDSRTYRLADATLEQISVDHSVVQELVDGGELDRAAAAAHPDRNVITRALGAGGEFRPDYWLVPIESGDRILICSDGVSGELDDAIIARVLREEPEPQNAATRLVHEGILRGGRDNLTAVVVDAFDRTRLDTASHHEGEDTIPRGPVIAGGRN